MTLFRSEEMNLFMLSIKANDAKEVIEKVGEHSCLHFLDVFEEDRMPNYMNIVHRCEEMEAAIKFIEGCCREYEVNIEEPESWAQFLDNSKKDTFHKGKNSVTYFEDTEKILKSAVAFLKNQQLQMDEANEDYRLLLEKNCVLKAALKFIKTHNM